MLHRRIRAPNAAASVTSVATQGRVIWTKVKFMYKQMLEAGPTFSLASPHKKLASAQQLQLVCLLFNTLESKGCREETQNARRYGSPASLVFESEEAKLCSSFVYRDDAATHR